MSGGLNWREGARVELRPGYALLDGDGVPRTRLTGVRLAIEGGFVHVAVPGATAVQVVSAPAVAHLDYPAAAPAPAE
ncbi:hypothetical protein GCM10009639_66580 [Kitasatospora putterlickiae]|uniref:Uncharacterized protein n=1 Tax=Kitasatospora putterlickiae TaxID=221725 RepID=A0ABN1YH40_9ACTN